MNKKILLSLCVIGAVAAIAVGGTIAYFSDTETSTGNTFTAGSLDLKVDNTCHYNGKECVCDGPGAPCVWEGTEKPCSCTWELTDLDNQLFFNFPDVKPGDTGEDTISLHVYDNDAYLCAYVKNLTNYDNGCNEPEFKAETEAHGGGSETCGNEGMGEGELQDHIYLTIWYDVSDKGDAEPCDNIWQTEEIALVVDTAINGNDGIFPLGQLKGDETTCLGVMWRVPSETGNIIQTDSVTGDIEFYVEQVRNNPTFVCPGLN